MIESHLGEPVTSPDSLLDLLSTIPEEKRRAVVEKLASAPREKLEKVYRESVSKRNRKNLWLIAEEFTRRGVPPEFRPSVYLEGKPRIPEDDILLHDLQWLGARYAKHRPLKKKFAGLFSHSRAFDWSARQLMKARLHQPWYYLKLLSLTGDQQIECIYLRGAPIRRRMEVIARLSEDALERLKIANRVNLRARAQTGDWKKTVERRHAVWRCGSMADWQPQRTAELYKALTGENMSRSLAGKLIGEVHRDYPDSKPKRTRTRRTRRATADKTVRTRQSIRSGKKGQKKPL